MWTQLIFVLDICEVLLNVISFIIPDVSISVVVVVVVVVVAAAAALITRPCDKQSCDCL